MMTDVPVTCTLSKVEFGKRQDELNTLKQSVREVRQTENGFALCFDGCNENLTVVANYIA